MCIAVYTNLHDTVRYVNSHDIHPYLSRAEAWLFGGQPVLWAEAYITPARTEFFNAFYANFYLVAPSIPVILWLSGRRADARTVLLGIIVCFYTGYVLYLIFPAAPPRLYYASLGLFKVTLRGGPITHFQEYLIGMMPNHAERAAFPSLHAAVSTLSLCYAWRHLEPPCDRRRHQQPLPGPPRRPRSTRHVRSRRLIPHRWPFLLVDRIVEYDPDAQRIVGLKGVTAGEWFFAGHFRGCRSCPVSFKSRRWPRRWPCTSPSSRASATGSGCSLVSTTRRFKRIVRARAMSSGSK